MIPWIQIYSNLPVHPKTYKLAERLKIGSSSVSANVTAAGMLVSLWSWMAQNKPDGVLSDCSPQALADAAGWRKRADVLLSALEYSGYADTDEDGVLRLHDWEDYALLLMEQISNQKCKTKERVKRYRERKKVDAEPEIQEECNVTVTQENEERNGYSNVTVTPCNGSTLPYPTVPNRTIDTKEEDNIACAREEIPSVSLDPGLGRVMTFLMDKINPTPSQTSIDELKTYTAEMGPDVVIAAMDTALGEKKTSWSYIRAILRDWLKNGIRSLSDYQQMLADREAARERSRSYGAGRGADTESVGGGGEKQWNIHYDIDGTKGQGA